MLSTQSLSVLCLTTHLSRKGGLAKGGGWYKSWSYIAEGTLDYTPLARQRRVKRGLCVSVVDITGLIGYNESLNTMCVSRPGITRTGLSAYYVWILLCTLSVSA